MVRIVTLLLLGLVVACQKGAARECDRFFSQCPTGETCDFATNQCVAPACDQCAAPTPACDTDTGTCEQCVGEGPQDDCPNRSLCNKNECVQCAEDRDCPEGLCARTGGCPKIDTLAFVTASGTANTTCSSSTPCTLVAALATGREFLHVRGNHTLSAPLMITRTVRLYGPIDGARPRITSTSGAVLDVAGNVTVELSYLELGGAVGASGHGIFVRSGVPTLDLDNVDIIGNAGLGISAGGATLAVAYGIIAGNSAGGIDAAGAVRLTSNIIAGNGSAGSATGGVRLTGAGAGSAVRFNTIANNTSSGAGSGLACTSAFATSSNIFAGNTLATCTATYSLFPAGTTVPGTGNKAGDPQFLATTLPANRDDPSYYHIPPSSPAAASGAPLGAGELVNDVDGDQRQNPTDIGADER